MQDIASYQRLVERVEQAEQIESLRIAIEEMKAGYIQVEIDQQPYEQGFLPVMQVYLEKKVGLAPSDIDSGEAVFTPEQADQLMALAMQMIVVMVTMV